MLINQIQHKNKKIKRVGRGGKKGTYSGKGMKGQKSRAGRKIRPAIRDIIIKLPKKRGYKFNSIREKPIVVNLSDINKEFNDGETVSVKTLVKKNIIKISKSKYRKKSKIKILSDGELNKKLIFDSDLIFSEKTKEKILKSDSRILK